MITEQLFLVDLFKKRYWQGLEPHVWKDRSLYLMLTTTTCTILHKLGSATTFPVSLIVDGSSNDELDNVHKPQVQQKAG